MRLPLRRRLFSSEISAAIGRYFLSSVDRSLLSGQPDLQIFDKDLQISSDS